MIVSRTSDGLGKVKEDITPVEVPSSKTKMIIKKTKLVMFPLLQNQSLEITLGTKLS